MDDPPPSATWHPALRPETIDDSMLYSPELDGPRQVTLSWDDVVARTPMRSRAPTHTLGGVQQTVPAQMEEDLEEPMVNEEAQVIQSEAGINQGEQPLETLERNAAREQSLSASVEQSIPDTVMQTEKPELEHAAQLEARMTPEHILLTDQVTPAETEEERLGQPNDLPISTENDVQDAPEPQGQDLEARSPLGMFSSPDDKSGQDDIDAAWGELGIVNHTNSFPPVPSISTVQSAVPVLAQSQASAVIQEEESVLSGAAQEAMADDPWGAEAEAVQEDNIFFAQSRTEGQGLTSPADDEARFEEGIPLVVQEISPPPGPGLVEEPDFDFSHVEAAGDDFFSGLGAGDGGFDTFPAALERKSTEQVLSTMQLSQDTRAPDTGDIANVAADVTTIGEPRDYLTTNAETPEAAPNKDLAAMWEAALDDDLLDENADPSSFFGDEDDGFLLDEQIPSTTEVPQPQQSQSQYAPAGVSYPSAGYSGSAYNQSQSFYQAQVAKPSTAPSTPSFADQSKGGYQSPYDAPMDLSRPKRAPVSRAPTVLTRAGPAAPPPPRRSDSYNPGVAGTPTTPAGPSTPSSSPAISNYQQATMSPQSNLSSKPTIATTPKVSSSGFFEELPMTIKPRASVSRFVPPAASQQHGPPSGSPYQQIQQQDGPPQYQQQSTPPLAARPPPPPSNPYGLVGPSKVMPFEEIADTMSTPPSQPVAPSTVAGRYSPSIVQQPGQSQPQIQTARSVPPNPYANAQPGIIRPPSVPHQHTPHKPSPLSRSSSANQYRPNEQPIESTSTDVKQGLGVRRLSLLRNTTSRDDLNSQASPGANLPPNQLGILPNGYTPVQAGIVPQSFQGSGKHLSQLPPHQEVVTPGTAPTNHHSLQSSRTVAAPVESYSVTQQAILTSTNRVRAPSLTGDTNFMPPTDVTAQDPLERWKGAPLFRFGFGGTVTTMFPTRIPRYSAGSRLPAIKSGPGDIRIHTAKILPPSERLSTFPGPLKNKSKKKDLLAWLHNSIASLAQNHAELVAQSDDGDDHKRHEEKIMLWRVLATLVEYDGMVEGNPQALDAIRKVLSPEASVHKDQETVTQPLLPAISSPDTSFKPSTAGSSTIETLRQFLLLGEREKAVWHAVDQKLWGHAMLIASTMPRELWKQISHEFVKIEVRPAGRNTESLAALFDVFAGNWEESVDELVPPSARAGLKLMSKNSSDIASSGLDGLNRWRETLNLILSNRTAEDSKAIVALGQLLSTYGRNEAAHICFIFANLPGLFGGPDDTHSLLVLLGVNHKQHPLDYAKDSDSILLTEVYEFITSTLSTTRPQAFGMPHLQAFKLYHAELLAELGQKDDAQQYCDAIAATMKANTNKSPYFHHRLALGVDELGARLRSLSNETGKSWMSRPNVDKMSGSFFKGISRFIAGDDDDDASQATARADTEGPFARINGNTPELISRNSSPALGGYGQIGMTQNYSSTIPGMAIPQNSRYAPGAAASPYAPQLASTPERSAPISNGYEPSSIASGPYAVAQPQYGETLQPAQYGAPAQSQASKYSPDITQRPQISQQFSSSPLESAMSPISSDASSSRPGTNHDLANPDSLLSPEPRSNSFQARPPSAHNRYSPAPLSSSNAVRPSSGYEPISTTYQPRSYAPSPNLEATTPHDTDSYQPSAPMYGEYSLAPSQTDYNESVQRIDDTPTQATYEPNQSLDESTTAEKMETPSYGGYEPPSYGYEPPSYNTVEDAVEEEETKSPPKKKSFMDLDDDDEDIIARAAALKGKAKQIDTSRSREPDDAVRRAAEEDAKRDQQAPKSAGGGWLSSFWGKGASKEAKGPEVHKAKLGEESSFYFDKDLGKWVNKKGGAEAAGPSAPTPPPPRGGPPGRAVTSTGPPPAAAKTPTYHPASGPTSGTLSPTVNMPPTSGPPIGLAAGLAPPSRPSTGMSSISNTSSVDDLMGPAQPRKGGTVKKGKKGRGYVDVLAK